MEQDPPNWQWCQNTTSEERKKYFDLLSKAPPSETTKLLRIIKDAQNTQEALLYYLTLKESEHKCKEADLYQKQLNQRLLEFIYKYSDAFFIEGRIKIFCLGHSEKQFNTIQKQPYLETINLNNLCIGEHSGNEWAEARAFLSEELFATKEDFIGLTSASWNNKYEPFSRIDNFHNWESAKILVNSKPKDKIVLCADIFCPCCWLRDLNSRSILSHFFGNDGLTVGRKLLSILDLELKKHIRVPFGNQIIAHKTIFNRYRKFLFDNEVLDKVDFFIKNHKDKLKVEDEVISQYYHHNRIQAYIMEMVSCFWFAQQEDFCFLPNASRRKEWYNPQVVKERIDKWGMTSL